MKGIGVGNTGGGGGGGGGAGGRIVGNTGKNPPPGDQGRYMALHAGISGPVNSAPAMRPAASFFFMITLLLLTQPKSKRVADG